MSDDTYQLAKTKLTTLIENARKGAIIPVQLPGQLEEIEKLLAQSEAPADTPPPPPEPTADADDFKLENAKFLSTAIHELRTPMTSIRGYSDMLGTPSMGELNDMQKQFLATIRANARRMEGLLNDVSDIGKLRGDVLIISKKMDMFKNIAMMVENSVKEAAEAAGHDLTFDIPQGLPLLNTDGEMLAKALTKLVENAVRYTLSGGKITMKAVGEGSNLVITVQDNGIGMSPEDIQSLGTLFFRADRDEVREHKGSGLGIPIAYGILKLLDVSVQVESTVDEGTTFTLKMAGMS